MLIYLVTNNINGKKYVGQTIRNVQNRFSEHCSPGNVEHSALTRSILKYGKEFFTIEQIDSAEDIDELNAKEKYWVDFYDSLVPNGYNICNGGNGTGRDTAELKKIKSIAACKRTPKTLSGYKCVSWNKDEQKYCGVFGNKKEKDTVFLGFFNSEINNAIAHDIVSHIKRPGFGYLNFPQKTLQELIEEITEKPSGVVQELIKEYRIFKKESFKKVSDSIVSRMAKNVNGYRGVCLRKKTGKFHTVFKYRGDNFFVGNFEFAKNSAIVYDILANIKRPEIGIVNFPGKSLNELMDELTEPLPEKVKELL